MNLRKKITVILSTGLFIILVVGINAYQTVDQLVTLNNWVVHTQVVLQKAQQVQDQLITLDNDLRGHLLSENSFFEADYARNAGLITAGLRKLRVLTVDNPDQQKRLRSLSTLLGRKLSQSSPLFRPGAVTAGNPRLDSIRVVLDISDQFRLLMNEVQSNEDRLLASRNAQSDRSARYAIISNTLGASVALLLIAWAIYLLVQTLGNSHQINKNLADSEQRIQKFLDAVPIAVVVIDANGDFYYANAAATHLFGNTAAHFGTYANTLKKIVLVRSSDGQPYPIEERPIYRAMRGEATQVDDIEMRLDDQTIQVMTSAMPVYDSDGELKYVISSSVDISDRVQSALRLQEAKEMAEEAARLKESFLANMSHEIRTPLNAMLGFTNLLETTPLDSEQQDFVSAVRIAGKNLLTIVNDILDISKIEAGMLQFESIPFNIDALLGSVQTMFLSVATDKNLRLVVENNGRLPAVLLGDPTRLTQILMNLISNSIKFTKEGGVTISTQKIAETSDSVRVRFVVEDTGIGMAADVLPHIFERFRQATDFTTRYYGGTGLGLNIVKSLTEMQGGSVTVESTLGKGSRFSLEITYLIAEELSKHEAIMASPMPGTGGHPMSILVVEDNLMNQKLAIQVLKRLGCSVQIAENGQKAIEKLQTDEPFDVILMDIQMPIMDGYETTRHIRTKLHSSVPIIAMTAHALASERELCLQAGMNDFLPKPFQIDDLQRILRKYAPTPTGQTESPAVAAKLTPLATSAKASFSVNALLQSVEGDVDFAAEILELFLNQTESEINTIQQAVADGNADTISRILHTQKVPTQMFAMTEVTRLIQTIESMVADRAGMDAIAPLVDDYICLLRVELPFIRTVLQTTFNRVLSD